MEVQIFNFTGEEESVFLNEGVYKFQLWGASGGLDSSNCVNSGRGGYTEGVFHIRHQTKVFINVGGHGSPSNGFCNSIYVFTAGGYNGGGDIYSHGAGCSGGGATNIRFHKNLTENRVIISGGGGGGSYNGNYGGDGGGEIGGDSSLIDGMSIYTRSVGHGGNQTHGGDISICSLGSCIITMDGHYNSDGSFGLGGNGLGYYCAGGGGGGGWYGGGGNYNVGGGGGGSSYVRSDFTDINMIRGVVSGHGSAIITLLARTNCGCVTKVSFDPANVNHFFPIII